MDSLRLLQMVFTAPLSGLRLVRERELLLQAFLLAWVANTGYFFLTQWHYWIVPTVWGCVRAAAQFTTPLMILAFVVTPIAAGLTHFIAGQGTWRESVRQNYTALLASFFYVWAAACLWALPLALLEQVTGWRAEAITRAAELAAARRTDWPPEFKLTQLPRFLAMQLAYMTLFPFFVIGLALAVREVFRVVVQHLLAIIIGTLLLGFGLSLLAFPLFWAAAGSPFLILLVFLVLRGYFLRLAQDAQGRTNFKRYLETSTLNPADASAHYNLGLIHLRRNQLADAQERFQKALEIDPSEVDAHYQLGRLARAGGRWTDAISHFSEVVSRDENHAQHEIWREIGATYLAAEQFADARAMLERFRSYRLSDPQGLYLLGRAYLGLNRTDDARAALNACLEAVNDAPNFQYADAKRWRTEAQKVLRTF